MRRADRLFLIIHTLRGRRAVTARRLAETLRVSARTVYRDVADLQLSGIPIEGAAGVGYTLRRGREVPPPMFTQGGGQTPGGGGRFTAALAPERVGPPPPRAPGEGGGPPPRELPRRAP